MFGYLMLNAAKLDAGQKKAYQQAYCGLCHALRQDFGPAATQTLSYDLTFIDLLLTSLYGADDRQNFTERCPMKPIRPHECWCSPFTHHAADMNVYLTYYKCLDDWHDDHNRPQKDRADRMAPWVKDIRARHGQPCAIMERCLADLTAMEHHNELNSDLPANCFGTLMQQVFVTADHQAGEDLSSFGFHLGKFIYLMDACLDLKDDLRRQRYNPLIGLDMSNYQDVLMLVASDMTAAYERLPLHSDKDLLDNVLYSGIWSRYEIAQRRTKKKGSQR